MPRHHHRAQKKQAPGTPRMQMQECRCLHLGTVTVPCRGQPFPSFNDTPRPEQKQQTNLFRKKKSPKVTKIRHLSQVESTPWRCTLLHQAGSEGCWHFHPHLPGVLGDTSCWCHTPGDSHKGINGQLQGMPHVCHPPAPLLCTGCPWQRAGAAGGKPPQRDTGTEAA